MVSLGRRSGMKFVAGFLRTPSLCRRLLAVLLLAPLFTSCATVPNALSPDQIPSLKLTAVNVGFSQDARIVWGDGERAYAASKGLPFTESDKVANTPEGQAYVRNIITSKVKSAMQDKIAERLNGSRPVRVEVTVTELAIASTAQRIIIGGSHGMTADVAVVDAKTGEILAIHPALHAPVAAGQGFVGALLENAFIEEPIDRVTKLHATLYSIWLLYGGKKRTARNFGDTFSVADRPPSAERKRLDVMASHSAAWRAAATGS
jgi:Family of unknown function (DUF6778)